ncbi:hypothetical protein FisN_1Hh649 [Fistulifera solaris]|uniref:AB hydrolase-1 domain-containing protein n=1 Tax=Fistulifera solaris TaxID=1519565 RepID=A0A1Z5KRE1_FISSO|nr:hypothetical protein FisN_1Hh649 [Fistulifera solaris]|eukprot:GAX28561.1 hypothetical protein FisN_1Hh649 [Fistulifera solaris]
MKKINSLSTFISALFVVTLHVAHALVSPQPQTLQDLVDSFQQVYRDLERPSALSTEITPTLRFDYIAPPSSDGQDSSHLNSLDNSNEPLAVYLPGLDGYGISAVSQFDDLARTFETWRLVISPNDTSTFLEVVDAVALFIKETSTPERKVTLIGESCGGLIASAVAIRLRKVDLLEGLVLVNPATSFDQTWWDTLVPLLAALPKNELTDGITPYGLLGSFILGLTIPDRQQQQRILDTIVSLPSLRQPNPALLQNILETAQHLIAVTEERLPASLLEHRVTRWLLPGTAAVRLEQINVPTLVIAGKEDALVPSATECDRLLKLIPHSEKLLVRNRGHFVLDDSVNLTEAILYSNIDPFKHQGKKPYDPILDWTMPTEEELEEVLASTVRPLERAHSPVFFSTDSDGYRWRGLSKIDMDGPVLFVGNHQFFALDLNLIFAQMLKEKNKIPRGLAHPVAVGFGPFNELKGRTAGIKESGNFARNFQAFGAVPVTPRNFYRLLQSGQPTMLFPGGAKEALSISKDYALKWPEKVDFVRTAARFNATIIPFSAIGMVDSVNGILEVEESFNLPFIGKRLREGSLNVTAARYDTKKGEENMGFPIFTPAFPERNYFIFGKPIYTRELDPNDRDACEKVYRDAKQTVQKGLDDLRRARKEDPFNDTLRRLAYEQIFGKQASTFPIELISRQ